MAKSESKKSEFSMSWNTIFRGYSAYIFIFQGNFSTLRLRKYWTLLLYFKLLESKTIAFISEFIQLVENHLIRPQNTLPENGCTDYFIRLVEVGGLIYGFAASSRAFAN